ncbi:sensor histidine kinase [Nocardioides pantholopis]|uniref:sensor histidine kinase n=1 Tax=Nocardioides pantholopis TaxID=2483798 RepID=UPI0013E28C24|nr:HAMP domain-containing sensor histidine kinase [Nocardioides pantholopis]
MTGALQDIDPAWSASAEATDVTVKVLAGEWSVTESMDHIGHLLSSYPGVDAVTATMVQLRPDDDRGWIKLGARAWLRVWDRPGTSRIAAYPRHPAADQALSLPWLSQLARRSVVALADTDQLPREAAVDRAELTAVGVAALASRSILWNDELFGALAIAREHPGPWPRTHLADLRLLSSALASRMAALRMQQSLSEAMERAHKAVETQHHFFAAMGHELRTPIAAILGSADILVSDADDAASAPDSIDVPGLAQGVRADAKVIQRAGDHLLAIVEDLLRTGKALGGPAEREPVNVADAVDDVIHWLRAPSQENDVAVLSLVPPEWRVLSRPSALRQILTNLVGNAIAYHRPGGSVHVSASRAIDEFGDPRIRIRVQDDGPGLTTKQQREVFKPFVRFADPVIKGTGLGLPLSRTLAERDGGLMGVESVPGEGSSFWVDLPAAPAQAPAAEADPDDRLAGSGQHSPA